MQLEQLRQYISDQVFKLRPADYGVKFPKWPGSVGLELEMFVFYSESLARGVPEVARLYESRFNQKSLSDVLISLCKKESWTIQYLDQEETKFFSAQVSGKANLSFEPGGQLEISTLPFPCLSDAVAVTRSIQKTIDLYFAGCGFSVLQAGINPWQTVDEIGLQMDKPRYKAMDAYFTRIGSFGRRMMRQTCTQQVNLDLGNTEELLAKRFALANLIAPFLTAMFAYSPQVNRTMQSNSSSRAEAWRHIDGSRTGVFDVGPILKSLSKAECVEQYLKKVIAAPVIFITEKDYKVPPADFSFTHWIEAGFDGIKPTINDFVTHLSLFFPEVRVRGFLELRSMDCQSRVWQDVAPLFCTTLFYVDRALNAALQLLEPHANSLPELLERATHKGIRDEQIAGTLKKLSTTVLEFCKTLSPCFLEGANHKTLEVFVERFVMQESSPSEELRRAAQKNGSLDPKVFGNLEMQWRNSLIAV